MNWRTGQWINFKTDGNIIDIHNKPYFDFQNFICPLRFRIHLWSTNDHSRPSNRAVGCIMVSLVAFVSCLKGRKPINTRAAPILRVKTPAQWQGQNNPITLLELLPSIQFTSPSHQVSDWQVNNITSFLGLHARFLIHNEYPALLSILYISQRMVKANTKTYHIGTASGAFAHPENSSESSGQSLPRSLWAES